MAFLESLLYPGAKLGTECLVAMRLNYFQYNYKRKPTLMIGIGLVNYG